MKKLLKLSGSFLIAAVLLLPAGLVVYSAIGGHDKSSLNQSVSNQSVNNQSELNQSAVENKETLSGQVAGADTANVRTEANVEKESINISDETKELIKSSDKKNYDTNLTNYTDMVTSLHVHEKYMDEMDRLLTEGYKLPDILTAYSFLNDNFGKLKEIEELVKEKESGKAWADIFQKYNKKNPEFVPRSFEEGYIEEVMKDSVVTADDIMLADRVSQKAGITIQEVMEKRMGGETWKNINAEIDILNGEETLPRITVAPEQIDKYVNAGMDRDVVVEGYVIAMKLSLKADTVMKELKAGTSVEELLDKYYTQKYY
jgi:hypothetical protein